jgi:hypothetical protein
MPEQPDEKTLQVATFASLLPLFEEEKGIGIDEALLAYTWRQMIGLVARGNTIEGAAELCREAADHVGAAMIATRNSKLN